MIISTGVWVDFLRGLADEQKSVQAFSLTERALRNSAQRLVDFAELITFLTGRDADEYLRDAKTTGYPPLTSTTDVRTTVLGDSAPTNEIPK